MTQAQVRILLADDHTLVRHGVRKILGEHAEWQIVDEACDGREAVAKAIAAEPDLVVIDIGMPLLSGIEATRQIVRRLPATRVLVVSMYSDEAYILQALQAGASGYLLKDSADEDLVDAVTAVVAGKSFFSPAVAKVMLDDFVRHLQEKGVSDRYQLLSEREREVLQLVAEGRSNKEVAELLCLSPTTIETHRARIMQKLGVHNTAELVLFAVRRGLIS